MRHAPNRKGEEKKKYGGRIQDFGSKSLFKTKLGSTFLHEMADDETRLWK